MYRRVAGGRFHEFPLGMSYPLQAEVFRTIGLSDEEARAKFGFFLDALSYGAPPPGGIVRPIPIAPRRSTVKRFQQNPRKCSGC